ncbi:DUF3850 domain-containing protein [Flavobacterium alkalisoli]|uniref:DUF3850 domain-containing protein n=1 Tax=Flavobacterium alkalisoli TaxID=2602769 RepID=A0A5B9FRY2_9FLAO|nr:ASCH/PUA domain-containing protein [Flavobacterium alkalisoli]QEE49655.1 DUF3850 domain-containing protein [Flavobacterium alkalisoli]
MLHKLKTLPTHFNAVKDGRKNFEIRKNDRHFQIDDELLLEEFEPKDYWDPEDPKEDRYTGSFVHRRITYIVKGKEYGLKDGYVVLGIEKI